jgi:SnoaL-like domain
MSHPFTQAIAARDADALIATLAPDVVLYSAVTKTPFEGRDIVTDTYRSVLESFEDVRVVDEFESGNTHSFWWEGRIEGRYVAGADRFRLDAEGRVREVTIVGRPMSGVATFVTGIGFRLARRRRGALVARILRLSSLPLPPMLTLLDPVTRWVLRERRS